MHPGGYCHVPSALFEEARKANADTPQKRTYKKATDEELRSRLNDLQYAVTQKAATEAPHKNAYDKEFRPGHLCRHHHRRTPFPLYRQV